MTKVKKKSEILQTSSGGKNSLFNLFLRWFLGHCDLLSRLQRGGGECARRP